MTAQLLSSHLEGANPLRTARSAACRLFFVLLFLRLLADASFVPGGVSSALNLAIVWAAIVGGFLASTAPAGRKRGFAIPLLVAAILAWGVLALYEVGLEQAVSSAILRFLAILGMVSLARTAVREIGALRFATTTAWVSFPAVALVAVGGLTHSPLLFAPGTGRSFGTFNHTNSAASFMALYVLLCVFLLAKTKRRLLILPLLTALTAAVSTVSMGGLAALTFGLGLLLLASGLNVRTKVAALVGASGVVGAVLASGALDGRLAELTTTVSFEDATGGSTTNSLDWRFYNWKRLLTAWEERPLMGWGLGRADYDLQPLGKQPHNEFVRLLVESGIVGSTLLLAVLVTAVVTLIRNREIDPWGKALAAGALGALCINAVAANTLSYAPTVFLCIALWAIGSTLSKPLQTPRLEGSRRRLRQHPRAVAISKR